jgi:hypothetical protein
MVVNQYQVIPMTRPGISMPSSKQHARAKPNLQNSKTMKKFKYIFLFIAGLMAMSCTDESVTPTQSEDDPIAIPPPPTRP